MSEIEHQGTVAMTATRPISRELLGKIVDEVFDGAIEDPSVIEEIYAAIKKHETPAPVDHRLPAEVNFHAPSAEDFEPALREPAVDQREVQSNASDCAKISVNCRILPETAPPAQNMLGAIAYHEAKAAELWATSRGGLSDDQHKEYGIAWCVHAAAAYDLKRIPPQRSVCSSDPKQTAAELILVSDPRLEQLDEAASEHLTFDAVGGDAQKAASFGKNSLKQDEIVRRKNAVEHSTLPSTSEPKSNVISNTSEFKNGLSDTPPLQESSLPGEPPLDWSNFEGPKRNIEWKPGDQDLIYTAINFRDDEWGDTDEDAGQQIVERLLAAWRDSETASALFNAHRQELLAKYTDVPPAQEFKLSAGQDFPANKRGDHEAQHDQDGKRVSDKKVAHTCQLPSIAVPANPPPSERGQANE